MEGLGESRAAPPLTSRPECSEQSPLEETGEENGRKRIRCSVFCSSHGPDASPGSSHLREKELLLSCDPTSVGRLFPFFPRYPSLPPRNDGKRNRGAVARLLVVSIGSSSLLRGRGPAEPKVQQDGHKLGRVRSELPLTAPSISNQPQSNRMLNGAEW